MVVYCLTIVAFHTTLTIGEVLSAQAVAVTFAEKLYGSMAWIVPVFVALSTFGEFRFCFLNRMEVALSVCQRTDFGSRP